MKIEKKTFGQTKNGGAAELYTLTDGGISVDIITYGAAIRSINVPVGGAVRDVALGFDDIGGYETSKCFHGAVIGRIGNRVANAEYTMNGKTYKLAVNDGAHSLHGGVIGFDKQNWTASIEEDALVLTLLDKEGTSPGYTGDLTATVKYTLSGGELGIEYTATCTEDTPVNITNHCYFNLAGHDSGNIAGYDNGSVNGHKIQILSDYLTPVDGTLIPTGELMDVTGTPFDLRKLTPVAPGLASGDEQIKLGGGYDHNWVLSKDEPYRELSLAAVLECDGLTMECLTTKPSIQFYTGNMMAGKKGDECDTGKGGAVYSARAGLCLETQYSPNSVNTPAFPAPILRKGETYNHKTVYKFVTA